MFFFFCGGGGGGQGAGGPGQGAGGARRAPNSQSGSLVYSLGFGVQGSGFQALGLWELYALRLNFVTQGQVQSIARGASFFSKINPKPYTLNPKPEITKP